MTGRFLTILSLLVVTICVMVRCAQVVPLTGGKKDATPPKLLESTPVSGTTGFKTEKIILTFDEFVQVRDLPNQLIISPRLKEEPVVSAEGKRIIIQLDPKTLTDNTTYRLAFGKAISDMNESNPIENFEYVFSTGSFIDSLSIKGHVVDAFTTRNAPDAIVGLYRQNHRDSLPFLVVPDYIAKTNENGEFRFQNLPRSDYKIFAVGDKNKNNLYDGEGEKIGFMAEELHLNSDSTVKLKIFSEEPAKTFIKRSISSTYGMSQIILNKKSNVVVNPLNTLLSKDVRELNKDVSRDTIVVFYRNVNDSLQLVIQNRDVNKSDTLKLILPKNNQAKKSFITLNLNTSGNILPFKENLTFNFQNWMDTSRTFLKRLKLSGNTDSLIGNAVLTGHWKTLNNFEMRVKLKEGSNYTLKIDTGAFYNIYGNTNDSTSSTFKTRSALEFGKVTLKVTLNKKQNYLLQLINEQMLVIKQELVSLSLSSSNAATVDFTDVPPGVYQVKIIIDDNNNQKWDGGSVIRQKQPEEIFISTKLLKVLADWEIEEEINEKDLK